MVAEVEEAAVVEVAEGAAEDLVGAVGEPAVSAEVPLGLVVEPAGQVSESGALVAPEVGADQAPELVESEGPADQVPESEALAESVVRGGLVWESEALVASVGPADQVLESEALVVSAVRGDLVPAA